ncbi:NTP transferase domain-containing protein [Desulforhopalus vacuolatus]|uniref:DVU_1551 family NTP transferase n=1 Tax=Desulforhopalus vacuolatus TaxID=40414 RepID=UPI00196254B3|nr:NTP transferase domain-containing protein [Desulforhopalus vacuolatus]MBM9519717.1 NTP transferase domain-containing protein [Desulforhopalus vacuolatus]
MKSGAIILAAGFSSRMGDFKPLLQLEGKSLLAHCVDTLTEGGVNRVVAVIGHRGDEVRKEAKKLGIRCVTNVHYEKGMFSSVQVGVEDMEGQDAFFVLPVDIPLIRPATIKMLLKAHKSKKVTYPEFAGEKGHPPLISGELRREILDSDGSGGLAAVLEKSSSLNVKVWDRHILHDADTPEAFANLEKRAARYDILTPEEADILAETVMPPRLAAHCSFVAKISLALEKGMRQSGVEGLDRELIYGSALLHDICKGQSHHAIEGEKLLNSLGLQRMAAIVRVHSHIEPPEHGILSEKEIVCLADKLAHGSSRVALKNRYKEKLHIYKDDKEACRCIRLRLRQAEQLAELWEKSAEVKLETWLKSEELPL